MKEAKYIRWFEDLTLADVPLVGGKNASLGEMTSALLDVGVRVPPGFATTAGAYWAFLEENSLAPNASASSPLQQLLGAYREGKASLAETGEQIRQRLQEARLPDDLVGELREAYRELGRRCGHEPLEVATRSSATAEDLPEASFAGQQESFLGVQGEKALLDACRRCYASLFTDRAIAYRDVHGFDHMRVALSVGVQQMVRADASGVLFTLDTETGFPDVVLINAAWGLGENVVQGTVTPDQYVVFKPFLWMKKLVPILSKTVGAKEKKLVYVEKADDTKLAEGPGGAKIVNLETSEAEQRALVLSDDEILSLARCGLEIETHYGLPMDIEWAREEDTGHLLILQARPETVQSRRDSTALSTYRLKERGEILVRGLAIGDAIDAGRVCVIKSADDIADFEDGAVLVTEATDPDWVPIMKRAAGIVTDHGGRTSHAAIISRELGVPAIVGTGNATEVLQRGQSVTLSCAEGENGIVYDGLLDFEVQELDLKDVPETRTKIMINIASPAAAMRWWRLPAKGVGLARMEYLISQVIKVHPMALVHFDAVEDPEIREQIEVLARGYESKADYFVNKLAEGIATIAASRYPDRVIVRTSDFKTNEYAHLLGGAGFEPHEENPMLGWRGASRYYSEYYAAGFALECRALQRVRETIGFTNVVVMIPFCRTVDEAKRVLAVMAENGLRRGENDLEVYVMAEIPANVTLAEEFAEQFDGFSIGSNDLTQLMLGVDRDSERLAYLFDERNEAVLRVIQELIEKAHRKDRPVGICGQGPSDHPDFADFLVKVGIDSISLLPDSMLDVIHRVAALEARTTP